MFADANLELKMVTRKNLPKEMNLKKFTQKNKCINDITSKCFQFVTVSHFKLTGLCVSVFLN